MTKKLPEQSSLESPTEGSKRSERLARIRELVSISYNSPKDITQENIVELYNLAYKLSKPFIASRILSANKKPQHFQDSVEEICHATAVNCCYNRSIQSLMLAIDTDGASLHVAFDYTFKEWVSDTLAYHDNKVAYSLNNPLNFDDPEGEEAITMLRSSYLQQGEVLILEEEIVSVSSLIASILESRYCRNQKSRLVCRIALGIIAEDQMALAAMKLLPYHLRCRARAIKCLVEGMAYTRITTGSRYL